MAITYSVTQLVDPREPEVAGKFKKVPGLSAKVVEEDSDGGLGA